VKFEQPFKNVYMFCFINIVVIESQLFAIPFHKHFFLTPAFRWMFKCNLLRIFLIGSASLTFYRVNNIN